MDKKQKRAKVNRTYTAEYKARTLEHARTSGKSLVEIARDLGMPLSTLHTWHKLSGEVPVARKDSLADIRARLEAALEENRRLTKENKHLTTEREILKKAAAFFARESA